jgi:hypothetical protein
MQVRNDAIDPGMQHQRAVAYARMRLILCHAVQCLAHARDDRRRAATVPWHAIDADAAR